MRKEQWNKKIQKELEEGNDRSLIIVGCALLEDSLEELIKLHLVEVEKNQEKLFSSNNPLCTFSSKIEIAFRLGIIDKTVKNIFSLLRKIRNDCAHNSEIINLNSSPFKDRVNLIRNHLALHFKEPNLSERDVAVRTCMILNGCLCGSMNNIDLQNTNFATKFSSSISVEESELQMHLYQKVEYGRKYA